MTSIPPNPKGSRRFLPSLVRLARPLTKTASLTDQVTKEAPKAAKAGSMQRRMLLDVVRDNPESVKSRDIARAIDALLRATDAADHERFGEDISALSSVFSNLPLKQRMEVAGRSLDGKGGPTLIESQLMLWDNALSAQAEHPEELSRATERALSNGPQVLPKLLSVYQKLVLEDANGPAVRALSGLLRRCVNSNEPIRQAFSDAIFQALDTPNKRARKVDMLDQLLALGPQANLAKAAHDLVMLDLDNAVGPQNHDAAMALPGMRDYCALYTHELVLAVAAKTADITLPFDRLGRSLGRVYDAVASELADPETPHSDALVQILGGMMATQGVMSLDNLHKLCLHSGLTKSPADSRARSPDP